MSLRDDARGISEGIAVLVSAIVGIVVAFVSVWVVSGMEGSFEVLYRVNPTLEGGGVGTDFVAGNTAPLLDALIVAIHAVDVLMGLFILLMVFIHWGAFRRLGARMRPPKDGASDEVAADGGEPRTDGSEPDGTAVDSGGETP
jgi:hypothetical protein